MKPDEINQPEFYSWSNVTEIMCVPKCDGCWFPGLYQEVEKVSCDNQMKQVLTLNSFVSPLFAAIPKETF